MSGSGGTFELVDLIPFDVQFALTQDVDISLGFGVTAVVEDWMTDYFGTYFGNHPLYGNAQEYAVFDRIILNDRDGTADVNRPLTSRGGFLYTAQLEASAFLVAQANQASVPVGEILELQRTLLQDDEALQELKQDLRLQVDALDGSVLADLNAYLNTRAPATSTTVVQTNNDDQLKLVIIVAVAVACLAFIFLLLAIIWAWTYDRRNRQAYRADARHTSSNNNKSDTPRTKKMSDDDDDEHDVIHRIEASHEPPVQTIFPMNERNPLEVDSVITEDITSSLSAYYKSGLASAERLTPAQRDKMLGVHNDDAASVSSMGSYGYSLDGYAPTVATPIPSDSKPLPKRMPSAFDDLP